MSVTYSSTAINDRLLGVVAAIDSGSGGAGALRLVSSTAVVISTLTLQNPCGTVSGGILTFSGSPLDISAAHSGNAKSGVVVNTDGDTQVSGLSVGIPGSGADIIISNGLNTTFIGVGQVVQLLSGQIQGS